MLVVASAAPAYPLDSGPVSGYGHALAGTTRPESPWLCEDRNREDENWTAPGGFVHRLVVSPLPTPFWIPAFAGMTNGGRIDEGMSRMANERLPQRSTDLCFHSNRSCRLLPE